MVCNVFVGRNSSVVNCNLIICEGLSSYGTQRTISIGPESGNYRVVTLNVNASYAEVCANVLFPLGNKPPSPAGTVPISVAVQQSLNGNSLSSVPAVVPAVLDSVDSSQHLKKLSQPHSHGIRHMSSSSIGQGQCKQDDGVRFDMTIICDDVEISHCHLLRNVFVGSYSKVHCSSVDNSTLLSHCISNNAELVDCVMHGSSSVSSKAVMEGCLLFPHAEVSHGATVTESIIGPDAAISIGECKRSLVGPFIGFHHSSLLISSMWPLGRGNIAHGSMIGKSL
jgi:hypothetical protein